MKVMLGIAAVQVVAIGALSLTGCKSQEVLKDRPYIPAPSEVPVTNLNTLPPTPAIPEIKTEPIKYSVKSGDSFWKIAKQYGVSKEELAAYNNMSLQKPLKIGTSLMIPPGGALVSPEKLAAKSAKEGSKGAARPADGSYTVGNGDSLWKIAAKYNIKTDALIAANNIDPKKPLQVGQKLVIPETGAAAPAAHAAAATSAKGAAKAAPAGKAEPAAVAPVEPAKPAGPSEEELLLNELEGKSTPGAAGMTSGTTAAPAADAAAYDSYDVQEGDTVEDVAAMHGVRADDIRKANPGIPADGKLKPPMTLKIPGAK